jgi:hypothetical protein
MIVLLEKRGIQGIGVDKRRGYSGFTGGGRDILNEDRLKKMALLVFSACFSADGVVYASQLFLCSSINDQV